MPCPPWLWLSGVASWDHGGIQSTDAVMKYLHTMIRVRDLDANLRFFRDGLGLVETRRDGQTIYYRLASAKVRAILETLYRLYCAPDCA